MIKKITRIKDFGVFKNFSWQATIPEFKKYNLIYGWNYSGKTTFSRVFRCFELGKLHQDYLSATFELEDDRLNKYDQTFIAKPQIRVFNSDFIKDNLRWEEGIEPIFLLGEENIELQKELTEKKKELQASEVALTDLINEKKRKEEKIEESLTAQARVIGDLLSLRPFTKTHFRPIVERIKQNASSHILNEKDFDKYKNQAISKDKKDDLSEVSIIISSIEIFKNAVEKILQKQVIAQTIQKLLDNKELSDWVEKGKELHKEKVACEFCGNPLRMDLLQTLNKHFSKDYELLKGEILKKISELERNIIRIDTSLHHETSLYNDLHAEYKPTKNKLEAEIKNYNISINALIRDLNAKKDTPFDKLNVSAISDNKASLENSIDKINSVIQKHNTRTAKFEEERNTAREELKEHYAAEFETEEKYSDTLTLIEGDRQSIEVKKQSIQEQKSKILEIENKLSETVKGAEKVNEYLKIFFGKDDVRIEANQENKFKLLREGHEAKNLSEGEKTAISFAYFTAKLEERNTKISETIVYIDDPVSSLDSNHLFNTYSFVKNKYEKAKQLFISSHNFEFFNLLKDWITDFKQKDRELFLIERRNNGTNRESEIFPIHPLLKDFKSEYHYLFSIINGFKENPSTEFYHLYNMPNIIRRYLEAFLGFKVPKHQGLDKKLDYLIDDKVMKERILKFIHHYSHNNSLPRSLNFPDLKECCDVVEVVIEAVKQKDMAHFEALIESIPKAP